MIRNPDLVVGAIDGGKVVKPDLHKVFLLGNRNSQIVQHDCLYEGREAQLKLKDHVILAQITVTTQEKHPNDTFKHIENTPVGASFSFRQDPNILLKNSNLQRYLELFKFEDLMRCSTLYFAGLDNFKDNLEGISPYTFIKVIASHQEKNEEQNEKHFVNITLEWKTTEKLVLLVAGT